jgi:hypothetical protein
MLTAEHKFTSSALCAECGELGFNYQLMVGPDGDLCQACFRILEGRASRAGTLDEFARAVEDRLALKARAIAGRAGKRVSNVAETEQPTSNDEPENRAARALALHDSGLSTRAIAAAMKIPKSTAQRLLKRALRRTRRGQPL